MENVEKMTKCEKYDDTRPGDIDPDFFKEAAQVCTLEPTYSDSFIIDIHFFYGIVVAVETAKQGVMRGGRGEILCWDGCSWMRAWGKQEHENDHRNKWRMHYNTLGNVE